MIRMYALHPEVCSFVQQGLQETRFSVLSQQAASLDRMYGMSFTCSGVTHPSRTFTRSHTPSRVHGTPLNAMDYLL